MKKPEQRPFKKERQQTDNSLVVERGKTDDSFETFNEKAEGQTDKNVKDNRLRVDDERTQRRADADEQRDNTDQIESILSDERKIGDRAIKNERISMDSALQRERGEKERLMADLLSLERKETDKNLLSERDKADFEIGQSLDTLKVEQAAHLETQSVLTTRDEFVAIVSHDLRNPIGTILSSSQILLEDEALGLSEEARNWIKIIERNAAMSLRLIRDILDMERIEQGKIQLNLTKNVIADIINETVESFERAAQEKGVTLKTEALRISRAVSCDKDRISQVLSNLIGNAIKFTPKGGTVTITAEERDGEVEITVADTGCGISSEQKNHIFEKFAQLGNQDRTGIGLGLYISKTLIHSHGGEIWVTSVLGIGSRFTFTLPMDGIAVI